MRELPQKQVPGILSAPMQRMKMHGLDDSKVAEIDFVYLDAAGNRVGSWGPYKGGKKPKLSAFPGAVRVVKMERSPDIEPGD